MKNNRIRKRRWEFVRQFFSGNTVAFAVSVLSTAICVGANLMIAWLMQIMIDMATGAETTYTLVQIVVLCGACMAIFSFAFFLSYHSKPRFIAKAIGQYKEYAFQRISQKGISAFSKENSSFYISALSNDANTIEMEVLCNLFNILIDDVLLFSGAFILMLCYSPLLTGIGVILALLPVLVSLMAGNRVAEAEKMVSEKNEAYISSLNDSLMGFAIVKSFKAEAAMCRMFAERMREVSDAKTMRRKISIIVQSLAVLAGTIAQFGVFIIGIALALNGHAISAGTLIAFVNLMNYVVNPISSVPQFVAQCKASFALIDKLADALEDNVRDEGLECKKTLVTGIAVESLSFGYEEEKPVLRDVNFTFDAGKSYAIVGSSGSGKSTMLNLLMASHDNYTGSICYDEAELRQISSKSLYEMVSVVQQNVFIFNASIRDNITMFSDFPREEVDRAIELSGLSKLIAERGEDYPCGENGSGLSGGEKQRISIARSLLKKSQVLLVDEATAALDAQTAFQVSNAILDLNDLTRIVVTHALDENLLKRYDCVLTLKNGSITESGSFDELMEKKGYFYSLFTVSQ